MIGIDWGSSNLRAWRFDGAGAVLEAREAPRGIINLPPGGFDQVFAEVAGEWIDDGERQVLLCGMVGSRQGWVEVPYLDCPAGPAAIAAAARLLPMAPAAVRILPGLRCRGAAGAPDVMRGEETQLIGLLAQGVQAATLCLPGTHTKWAQLRDGQITGFATAMTGEVFAVLSQHSMLRHSLLPPASDPATPPPGFRDGLDQSRRPGGLLHQLFGLRARSLMNELPPEAGSGFLSGLLIGHDVAAALEAGVAPPILLSGASHLTALYAEALDLWGVPHRVVAEALAAEGLVAVGRELDLLH